MIRFGDVTYQIKGLLGDRNRSGEDSLTHLLLIYLILSSIYNKHFKGDPPRRAIR